MKLLKLKTKKWIYDAKCVESKGKKSLHECNKSVQSSQKQYRKSLTELLWCCYSCFEHSFQGHIQNLAKHFTWNVLRKIINSFHSITILSKSSILDVWQGSEHVFAGWVREGRLDDNFKYHFLKSQQKLPGNLLVLTVLFRVAFFEIFPSFQSRVRLNLLKAVRISF